MFMFAVLVTILASAAWGAPQSSGVSVGSRIVGGIEISIEAYPYMVSIEENNAHRCGGSIISTTWVVTAAHCMRYPALNYTIRAGSSTRLSGGEVVPATRIIIHESYNRTIWDYDIALVQLSTAITTRSSRVVTLAEEGGPPTAGVIASITGWGTLYSGGPLSETLQVVHVPIVSQEDCRSAYGEARITDRMFCAGLLGEGGKDACQYDSGGPLLANGVLTGIVSWGVGCARADRPGVYVNIPNLRSWIQEQSGI